MASMRRIKRQFREAGAGSNSAPSQQPDAADALWESSLASCLVLGDGQASVSVAVALLGALRDCGLRAFGMMPVSMGVYTRSGALERLAAAGAFSLPSTALCPYVFQEDGAPRAVAEKQGVTLCLEPMVDTYQALCTWSDAVVVAAPGDVHQPLTAAFSLCDLARELALPAILAVSGEGAGLLAACATGQALRDQAVPLAGWVSVAGAHALDSMQEHRMSRKLAAPLLGKIARAMPDQQVAPGSGLDLPAVLATLRGFRS